MEPCEDSSVICHHHLISVKEEIEKVGLKLNIQKTKIMASGPTTSWEIDGETVETVTDFIFLGSKITADGDCGHEIKRHLLLGRKSESEVTQSCPTLSDPMDYSPPGPPFMGFSRQEYWSGVPLPSPWKESYDQPRQHIKKQRYYFANKGPSSQGYGFFL